MRAKRQATITIFKDDNENQFTPRQTQEKLRDAESMELDELADVTFTKAASSQYNGADGRLFPSPSKIKNHFNTVKIGGSKWRTETTEQWGTDLLFQMTMPKPSNFQHLKRPPSVEMLSQNLVQLPPGIV